MLHGHAEFLLVVFVCATGRTVAQITSGSLLRWNAARAPAGGEGSQAGFIPVLKILFKSISKNLERQAHPEIWTCATGIGVCSSRNLDSSVRFSERLRVSPRGCWVSARVKNLHGRR
ncbi:hypothetical protein SF06_25080 [Pseudomonas flexibilis]|nr:hypothetical protein SF06_25080 [Pseudomonas flexibilis]